MEGIHAHPGSPRYTTAMTKPTLAKALDLQLDGPLTLVSNCCIFCNRCFLLDHPSVSVCLFALGVYDGLHPFQDGGPNSNSICL